MLFLLSPYQELCRCTRTKSLIVYHLPSVWLRKVVPHSKLIHHSELPAPHEFMMAAKLGWTPWRNLLSIGEFFFSLVFPTLLLFPPFSWLNVHTVHVPFPLKTTTVLISCLGIPPPLLCVNYFSYLNWSIPSRLRSTRRSLSPEPPSLSDPMAPSSIPGGIEPFRLLNKGFYCDFTLLPCSTACTNTTHSLGHKQRQSFSTILPCFRTSLCHLIWCLFTYI